MAAMSKYYRVAWSDAKQGFQVFERISGRQVSPIYQTLREAWALVHSLEYDMVHPS